MTGSQSGASKATATGHAGPFIAGTIAIGVLVALAFWPGYLSKSPRDVDAYTHFHAACALLWVSLLVAQPALIATRRIEWHRMVGRSSFVLAPLFVLSSILLAHFRFSRMDGATFASEAYTLYLPISAALLFGTSFALAMAYRRTPRLHARFIAGTALLLVDPVCARVLAFHVVELPRFWHYQIITFGIEAAVLVLLVRTLPQGSAPRRTFSLFAIFYVAVLMTWFAGARTPAWLAVADWFRGLPLT